MPLFSTSNVAFAERATPIFQALRTQSGRAGRAYIADVGDSNEYITPTADSGTVPAEYPGGFWEGMHQILHALYGCYGGPLYGYGSIGSFASANAQGLSAGSVFNGFTVTPTGAPSTFTDRQPTQTDPTSWAGRLMGMNAGGTTGISLITTNSGGIEMLNCCGRPIQAAERPRLSYSYMIPSSGGGTLRVAIRQVGNLTPNAVAVHSASTSDAWVDAVLDVTGSNISGSNGLNLQFYDMNNSTTNGLASVEKTYVSYWQLLKNGVTTSAGATGISNGPWYAKGGDSLIDMLKDWVTWNPWVFAEYMRRCFAYADYFVLRVCFKGNDVSDSQASMLPNGSQTGPASNTAAGYQQNIETLCKLIDDSRALLGVDKSRILIIDESYPVRTSYELITTFQTAAVAAGSSGNPLTDRLIVNRGSTLVPESVIRNLRWYNGSHAADTAHFQTSGYLGLSFLSTMQLIMAVDPQALLSGSIGGWRQVRIGSR